MNEGAWRKGAKMFSKYDLHEAMKITPGEWPGKGFTPQEMRVGIARASYYSTIVRNVAATSEHEGWTGEDKYTALAFHLLLRLETVEDLMLRRAELDPYPSFLFPNKATGPVKDAVFT